VCRIDQPEPEAMISRCFTPFVAGCFSLCGEGSMAVGTRRLVVGFSGRATAVPETPQDRLQPASSHASTRGISAAQIKLSSGHGSTYRYACMLLRIPKLQTSLPTYRMLRRVHDSAASLAFVHLRTLVLPFNRDTTPRSGTKLCSLARV
jgi:hypothetical protein